MADLSAPGTVHDDGSEPLVGGGDLTGLTGLTSAEAQRRLATGMGNDVAFAPSRSYGQIIRDNAFLSINVIIFGIGLVLMLMRLFSDALVTVGLVLLNVLIAVVQEVRAKRSLDRIALLSRVQTTVVRDGKECVIDPATVVIGDLLLARPGDQIMVDGTVVADGQAEIDASLLTGESVPVTRTLGDTVHSGSFVVSGRLYYVAERVGKASLANELTARARVFRPSKTPLQSEVDLVLRLMVVLILVLGGPIVLDLAIRAFGSLDSAVGGPFAAGLKRAYQGYSLQETVRSAAVVVGLVPQGLALMLTVNYAMGAIRLAGRGALLQQANAVESLSHVDVVCLDKTGTLTTNRLVCQDIHPLEVEQRQLSQALGDYAANTSSPNRTIDAIANRFPGRQREVHAEVPFSSARKWSAISFADDDVATWVLGAPDVLGPALSRESDPSGMVDTWAASGLRVLLLARAAEPLLPSASSNASVELPKSLVPAGLVAIGDVLQPDVAHVIGHFTEIGIDLRIISGDYTETVAALARQAGFGRQDGLRLVSGLDLDRMNPVERAHAIEQGHIFGRITPDQKLDIIQHLQEQGHYVGMVGDGVNDVLALKQAQVGIAMGGGSQASRAVADVVLLQNDFTVLPGAFREGQRIVRSSQNLLKLFLARSLSMAVAILGAGVIGAEFPFIPTHSSIPALLTLGIPTVALAAWAKPGRSPVVLLRSTLPFAIPAALTMGAVEGMIYISYLRSTGDVTLARTVLTLVATLCGLLLILFVAPPTRAWEGGNSLNGDRRVFALVMVMALMLGSVMVVPSLREFFGLAVLDAIDVVIIAVAVTLWAIGLRYTWRADVMWRWFGLKL